MVNKKMLFSVTKIHLIEQFRGYQLLLTNIFMPLLFFGIAVLMIEKSNMSVKELELLVNSQFFSTSLMFGVLTYSFVFPLQNIVGFKEEGTYKWLRQTTISDTEFLFGRKVANIVILNLHSIFVILLFGSLGYMEFDIILKLLVLINISFFTLNPLATILASKISNKNIANNIGTFTMLIIIFSLTFSMLFSSQLNINFENIQKFLIINPLMGYYDGSLVLFGLNGDYFFNSYVNNILYILIFALVITTIEIIFVNKKGLDL